MSLCVCVCAIFAFFLFVLFKHSLTHTYVWAEWMGPLSMAAGDLLQNERKLGKFARCFAKAKTTCSYFICNHCSHSSERNLFLFGESMW